MAVVGATGYAGAADRALLMSAIDNLGKGAAGQAVQNLNCMLGTDEGAGASLSRWSGAAAAQRALVKSRAATRAKPAFAAHAATIGGSAPDLPSETATAIVTQ